ncbi:hypothetical protein [Phenylobacterium sp.]|uniref:hypothetical protein n=1 Tax=Phenylobacterium sp. TaxID=1871053 RepID=UPI0035B16E1C
MGKLTEPQMHALRMVERRDWPAGEPRIGWISSSTRRVLLGKGLIQTRPGTAKKRAAFTPYATEIVDLTDAGRQALTGEPG